MKKKKENKFFHNSNLDTYFKMDGTFKSRRKYDKNGKAVKDLDIKHKPNECDHVHDIENSNRSKIHRNPTKSEQREINKAKKKRRLWK